MTEWAVQYKDRGRTGKEVPAALFPTVAAKTFLRLLCPTMASQELLTRLEQKAVQAEQMIDLLTHQVGGNVVKCAW